MVKAQHNTVNKRHQTRIRSWRSDDVVTAQASKNPTATTAFEEAEKMFTITSENCTRGKNQRALLCERRKRRCNHHAYDLGKHIRLVRLSQEKMRNSSKIKPD